MRPLADALRRALDLTVALAVLVLGSPLLAAIALAIRVTMGSPVLFRQRRLGRGGHPFDLVKFRTMRHPAPGREAPEFDAERLTRLGRFLRASSLDELPGMLNLLRGDITLVGPRPLPVHYWDRFRGDEYERFHVKPGITGLAQVAGRNTVGWDERLALDVQYVRTRSLGGDLRILARTVPMVLRRAGVDHADGVTMHALPEDRRSG
jgi:lipopolysaccharide/colanic/teichoic acid biosynthesis glycosyltransferase